MIKVSIGIVVLSSILLSACGLEDTDRDLAAKRSEKLDDTAISYINGCTGCHEIGSSVEGPSWKGVAQRYKDRADAKQYLINRMKNGGEKNWAKITGGAEMHAYGNRVSDAHLDRLMDYILAAK